MFTQWFAPFHMARVKIDAFVKDFMVLWSEALVDVAQARDALVLRDFHVDNLMILPERMGVQRCGLLDFQDALLGSCVYDLVSLTQDARRHVSPTLEGHLLDFYMSKRPELSRAVFLKEYHLLGAHRATKLFGNFERLSKRDAKHSYLGFLPRVMQLLEVELHAAGLTDILSLMNGYMPEWRGHPPR
ncbi:MAG: aminoglycoside/choline kinase family phosphotransferase [Paracoccaceae bacterium]|jgi:aminoglycoside/choline kinase family phosphotransferase